MGYFPQGTQKDVYDNDDRIAELDKTIKEMEENGETERDGVTLDERKTERKSRKEFERLP